MWWVGLVSSVLEQCGSLVIFSASLGGISWRGIGGISWRGIFPKATINHIGAVNSDHCPLLLDNPSNFCTPKPFRFEATLEMKLRSLEVINQAWSSELKGSDAFKLCRKQQVTCKALKKWNTKVFGFSNIKIARLIEKIRKSKWKRPETGDRKLSTKMSWMSGCLKYL